MHGHMNIKDTIIICKCSGLGVITAAATTTTTTTALTAAKWTSATVYLKFNTKKAIYRHRSAQRVKTGTIKYVLASHLSQYRETGNVRNLVFNMLYFNDRLHSSTPATVITVLLCSFVIRLMKYAV
jgi:hypothetical protein